MTRPTRETAGPGQESVWDYPRPAVAERTTRHVRIVFDSRLLADTRRPVRVLETSHPPSWYVPLTDVDQTLLQPAAHTSVCEWKGRARYFDLVGPTRTARQAAWAYNNPTPSFEAIKGHLAVYPALMDLCEVDGERARPQPGHFYGGWITSGVVGPFKGGPGSSGW